MTDTPHPKGTRDLGREIGACEKRKLRAQRKVNQGIWFGLARSGVVGWSIALPSLFGTMLGVWIDKHHPSPHSWTLMLLVIGLLIGCGVAWRWVAIEDRNIRKEEENGHE